MTLNQKKFDSLICPKDQGHLDLKSGHAEEPADFLYCATCGSKWPIHQGIPSFVELGADPLSELKQSEMHARDREYQSHRPNDPKKPAASVEARAVVEALGDVTGKRILDAGCGSGILTQYIYNADEITAIDFSRVGLDNFFRPVCKTLSLIHGDITEMPFKTAHFDIAISSQVIEHLPSFEQREKFISELCRVLRPGGQLILTAYNWDKGREASGIPKDGVHEKGIYYYCHEPQELQSLLEKCFTVKKIGGLNFLLPGTYRVRQSLSGWLSMWEMWDRLWRHNAWAMQYGKLLMAVCVKR